MPLSRCRPLFALLAVMMAVALLAGAAAPMQAQTPYFRAFSGTGTADGTKNQDGFDIFWVDDFIYYDGSIPKKTLITATRQYSGNQGTVTYNAYATTQFRGFYSTGSYSYGEVLNAYYPTGQPAGTRTPPFGYYLVSGGGSWMQHRFVSPEAFFGPYAVFRWSITGTEDLNLGQATSRVDFAVTDKSITGFNDLYNDPDVEARRMTRFGAGYMEYQVPIVLDRTLNFLFWGATFWQVNPNELEAITSPQRIYGKAMYMNTFDLQGISLYNEDGSPIRKWSLVDDSTGLELFNQDGRVTLNFVPEPGALALAASALLPLLLFARSRRARRK